MSSLVHVSHLNTPQLLGGGGGGEGDNNLIDYLGTECWLV